MTGSGKKSRTDRSAPGSGTPKAVPGRPLRPFGAFEPRKGAVPRASARHSDRPRARARSSPPASRDRALPRRSRSRGHAAPAPRTGAARRRPALAESRRGKENSWHQSADPPSISDSHAMADGLILSPDKELKFKRACTVRPARNRALAPRRRALARPLGTRDLARARARGPPPNLVRRRGARRENRRPRRASRAYLPPLLETPSGSGPLARLAPPRSPRSLRPTPSPFSQSSSVRRSRRSSSSPTRRRTRWRSR